MADELNVLESVARLSSDRDFMVFVEYIENCYASISGEMPECEDEIRLRWLQGQSQFIDRLLKYIAEARGRVEVIAGKAEDTGFKNPDI